MILRVILLTFAILIGATALAGDWSKNSNTPKSQQRLGDDGKQNRKPRNDKEAFEQSVRKKMYAKFQVEDEAAPPKPGQPSSFKRKVFEIRQILLEGIQGTTERASVLRQFSDASLLSLAVRVSHASPQNATELFLSAIQSKATRENASATIVARTRLRLREFNDDPLATMSIAKYLREDLAQEIERSRPAVAERLAELRTGEQGSCQQLFRTRARLAKDNRPLNDLPNEYFEPASAFQPITLEMGWGITATFDGEPIRNGDEFLCGYPDGTVARVAVRVVQLTVLKSSPQGPQEVTEDRVFVPTMKDGVADDVLYDGTGPSAAWTFARPQVRKLLRPGAPLKQARILAIKAK